MNNALFEKLTNMVRQSTKNITMHTETFCTNENKSLGINDDSLMGVIVSHTSGIVIDNWIRVIGQQHKERKGIFEYNKQKNSLTEGMLLVAYDIVGGIFAVNLNRFKENELSVWYFAPDTLEWECLDLTYPQFITWLINGDTDTFYKNMRWHSWKNDCLNVSFENVIQIYPFLWAKECMIETASKKVISFEEMSQINFEFAQKFT